MRSTVILLLFSAWPSEAAFIVTPQGYEEREGNYADHAPFGMGGYHRLQQVISAQEFSMYPQGLLISAMALREHSSGGFAFGAFLTNQINLSTTGRDPDGLSAVFSENVGANETVVLPGDQQRAFGGDYTPGRPTQFFFTIFRFSQPFPYNPQAGNLLVEIRNYGGFYLPPGAVAGFDAVFEEGDGVSQLLGNLVDSPTGILQTSGYIIQFEFTPIPEPTVQGLLILGLFTLCWKQRHHREHRN